MGLCTSKSTVTLDPSAHTLKTDPGGQEPKEGESHSGTPILGEGILMVQPVNSKAQGGGGINQTAKGYLELGGKSGAGGDAPTWRDGGEEEEAEEEGNNVEELIHFLDSEGSLQSEFLE